MSEIYASDQQLAKRFAVHRATIWRWANDPESGFPKPVALSPGCTRWKLADINAWEQTRTVGGAP